MSEETGLLLLTGFVCTSVGASIGVFLALILGTGPKRPR